MNDLNEVKAIAGQILTLAAELLRLVDMDETKRRAFIESAKKTPTGKYYISLAY